MTADQRQELRAQIDSAARHRVFGRCENGWGNPETGYKRGCRCDFCSIGTSTARKVRKRRRLARQVAA